MGRVRLSESMYVSLRRVDTYLIASTIVPSYVTAHQDAEPFDCKLIWTCAHFPFTRQMSSLVALKYHTALCHSVDTCCYSEYHSLDKQLDQLADYLTVMEGRSDRLAEDARQLLQEAREARTVATSNGHGTRAEYTEHNI